MEKKKPAPDGAASERRRICDTDGACGKHPQGHTGKGAGPMEGSGAGGVLGAAVQRYAGRTQGDPGRVYA